MSTEFIHLHNVIFQIIIPFSSGLITIRACHSNSKNDKRSVQKKTVLFHYNF